MQNTESAMIKEERRAESVCDNSISGIEAVRAERICDVFRMLSEPSRLKIVLTLLSGELCVYHILQAVGGTQSALSHQLRILKDNRVLRARREGQNVYYSLADEHVRQMVAIGLQHSDCGGAI
jgi:ArsR family transcriptional regulator